MQTKKMSLANIQGKLSRTEMKSIMAGSGGSSCAGSGQSCGGPWYTNYGCCTGLTCRLDVTRSGWGQHGYSCF